jgi:hypothetical protein
MTLLNAKSLLPALLIMAFAIAPVLSAEPDPSVLTYQQPKDFKWKDSTEYPGLKTAILYGDPSKPGPYAVANRFEPGRMTRPHFHPNDRYIVVLSGTWWVGTGEKFDPDSTTPMPAGTFTVHYGGKVHYDGAKNEPCEVIISGIGPATATRVGEK